VPFTQYKISAEVYFVLSQFTRFTDGRTDGRTEMSWLIQP